MIPLPPLLLPPGRAPLHLSLRHRPLHLLLPEGECSGARLWQDGLLTCGTGLQERYWRAISPGGHLDHVHEGEAQLLPLWRDPLLLQRAAKHLLPARARPHLRHLHDQCVSGDVYGLCARMFTHGMHLIHKVGKYLVSKMENQMKIFI